jgi:Domain of unknown function (DUF4062)
VAKAILELGDIPVEMEMFSAADEEQWKLIRRQIDQSDYYVGWRDGVRAPIDSLSDWITGTWKSN